MFPVSMGVYVESFDVFVRLPADHHLIKNVLLRFRPSVEVGQTRHIEFQFFGNQLSQGETSAIPELVSQLREHVTSLFFQTLNASVSILFTFVRSIVISLVI